MSLQFRGSVISTERENGTSMMAEDTIIFRYPKEEITSKSIIFVQPNELAVVVIQGQVQAVLPPGTHNVQSPQNPLSSFLSRFRYNALPFDTIVFYTSTTRHEIRIVGVSQTQDLVPLEYEIAVYYRVTDPSKLVFNVQFGNNVFKDADLGRYISPMIDQEVSSIINYVRLSDIFKKLGDVSNAVLASLKAFLSEIGIELISVRVIRLLPQDDELRRVIQLRDLGVDVEKAIRLYLAGSLASKNDPASVNMALGIPYYPNLSTLVNLPDNLIKVNLRGNEDRENTENSNK
ncbi:SPFH domain-containing protein [Sulfuracidifex metallicus]|uniref:SPFH domain-containing protein n=2 Tax=Sulfuracidifex metallicus TaxID=47303 RepID=A0A6A9QUZ3_SULME|nr:SPFH domain-containing protein [Sulfuracidifex metallicus]MUN29633.1 SPFH domain-containing protein [Sulfuracidifex metallicus DSM 6482 = JCM 9184]WOE49858.1 SPFH domain-containing protein [Sulfuracidifex metallicus DSM 6482 = JCM 9184]